MSYPKKLNFVGVGFQKCGTTSLCVYLRQDPGFTLPTNKELHHFCGHTKGDKTNQLQEFLKTCSSGQIIGEVTPCYIRSEESIKRLKSHNSNLKIIVCLRNPIDRFVSAYIHAHKVGAIPDKMTPEYLIQLEDLHSRYSWIDEIVSQGRYANFIRTLWEYFPKKNTKVVFLEELVSNRINPLEIKTFLNPSYIPKKEIDSRYPRTNTHLEKREKRSDNHFIEANHNIHTKFMHKSQEKLNPVEIRERCVKLLNSHYTKSSGELKKLLNRELPWE